MLTVSLDTPIDPRRGDPNPFSFNMEADKFVYRWGPAKNFWKNVTLFLVRDITVDAGLRISRSATPEVLPPRQN